MCLPSARAPHAVRHTCSDTYPLHAIQRAAHLRPIFHLTEHASARVSRLSLECAERRRCTTFSSPTCEIDIAQPPAAMVLVADNSFFVYGRRASERLRSCALLWWTSCARVATWPRPSTVGILSTGIRRRRIFSAAAPTTRTPR